LSLCFSLAGLNDGMLTVQAYPLRYGKNRRPAISRAKAIPSQQWYAEGSGANRHRGQTETSLRYPRLAGRRPLCQETVL